MHIRHFLCCLMFALVLTLPGAEARADSAGAGTAVWKHQLDAQLWSPLSHHKGALYFGCDNGNAYAFDVDARKVKWAFETGGPVRSAVVPSGDLAFFASDDGNLYAVALATGEEAWRFDLGSGDMQRVLPATTPPYEYDYLHSSPVVADGAVFVGSMDGSVYAVDAGSGALQWKFQTEGKVRATPVVSDGTIYAGSWDGNLYAINAADGELRWKFDTGGPIQGTAAVAKGTVIVGSRSAKIFAVSSATGELVWQHAHKDGSWVESSPIIQDGVVYIGSSDALKLFAFDLGTGKELWAFKTDGWSWGAPVIEDGTVYIGGISAAPYYFPGVELQAGFYAVDRKSGNIRWSMTPEPIEGYITGGVFAAPAVSGDIVFVAALDGYLYAVKR